MAEAKGSYISTNKLKAASEDAKGLMYGNKNVKMAWMHNTLVWDVWETLLSASDASLGSSYTELTQSLLKIQSYGTDGLGSNHDMAYTISPTSISANTSDSSKSHSVKVTQTLTGNEVNVTATQAGRVASGTSYGVPSVTSTSISTVAASGNVTRYLTVGWSQTKTITYDNGTTSSSTVTGTSTAAITNGSSSTGAYINNGGVYVPSAGATYYTSDRVAYTISQFSFTANGVSSGTVSHIVYLYQSANTYTVTSYEYSVSATTTTTAISSAGGSFVISATCQAREVRSFTSGSTGYGGWFNSTGGVSYSGGVSGVSESSFVGSASITVSVYENISEQRYPYVVVYAADNSSISKGVSVTQYAVSFVFTANNPSNSVAYDATSITLTGTSTRNGFVEAIDKNDVSVGSGLTLGSVTTSTSGVFSIPVTFSANSSQTAKSYSVGVTQPTSWNTLSFSITQAAAPANNFIWWESGSGYRYWNMRGKMVFGARLGYLTSMEGKTVTIECKKGSSVSYSESVTLTRTGTSGNNYYADLEFEDTQSNDGSTFYLVASYGTETETIELVLQDEIL